MFFIVKSQEHIFHIFETLNTNLFFIKVVVLGFWVPFTFACDTTNFSVRAFPFFLLEKMFHDQSFFNSEKMFCSLYQTFFAFEKMFCSFCLTFFCLCHYFQLIAFSFLLRHFGIFCIRIFLRAWLLTNVQNVKCNYVNVLILSWAFVLSF